MALFKIEDLRNRAKQGASLNESTTATLTKRAKIQDSQSSFDIFLSHSFADKDLILGLALSIEDLGYRVYIDWRDDPFLDRTAVSKATADKLKSRMKSCKCLLYSTTENSSNSKWMPWELGFKDGDNSKVAILPVATSRTYDFKGQEYLGIYPFVQLDNNNAGITKLWIHKSEDSYVEFSAWLNGKEP
jgi:hypothetical protein